MSAQRKIQHSEMKVKYVRKDSISPIALISLESNSIDTSQWLEQYNLKDYKSIFNENNISIEQLIKLSDEELSDIAKNTLSIKSILHRKRFLNAVSNTKQLLMYDDDDDDDDDDDTINNNNGNDVYIGNESYRSMSFTDDSKQSSISIDNNSFLKEAKQQNGGYKLYLFENQNEALKYQCSICRDICFNSVELSCNDNKHDIDDDHDGVFYCKLCLELYLKNNHNICPINSSHKNVRYFANKYMRKRVNNLIIHCPRSYKQQITNNDDNKYCEWKGKVCDLMVHLEKQCKYIGNNGNNGNNENNVIYKKRKTKLIKNKSEKLKTNKKSNLNELCHQNIQQIETLKKQIDIQHEQITILQKENKNLKSKLKKNNEDIINLQLQNKQILDVIHKLNKSNNNNNNDDNDDDNIYCYHSKGFQLYHPNNLIHKKIHKSSISIIHSQDIEAQIIERTYHPKLRNNGYWTCCNGDSESEGCTIEKIEIMRYPCCGRRENSDGCIERYECCDGDRNSIGCKDISYYPCCNKKKQKKNNGCDKRYICCKRSYPNSKGCKRSVK